MSEINFDLPSGKRTFHIDDHEIKIDSDFAGRFQKTDSSQILIAKVESLQKDIRELMWKIFELSQELERIKK